MDSVTFDGKSSAVGNRPMMASERMKSEVIGGWKDANSCGLDTPHTKGSHSPTHPAQALPREAREGSHELDWLDVPPTKA